MKTFLKTLVLTTLLLRRFKNIFYKSPVTAKILLLLMLPVASLAQVSVQNNGTLYVSTSADIFHVNGSFTNASGAALTNNGMFYISQNLSNSQSSMAVGTGTLFLNGSSLQTVSGTQTFKTYNLVTDNAAGFLLNNNLSASGVHAYTTGMISTSATPNYMIYEAGSSYSGSSDANHVNGWVKKFGSTAFTFPVGNASYLRPVDLSNLSVSGEFNVRYNTSPTPNYASLNTPLVLVDTFEYWTINRVSGGSAQVTMNWDQSKVPFPNVTLGGVRAASFSGLWNNIGGAGIGVVATSGTVTSNSTNIFNTDFVIGSTSWVLPLRIISFSASRSNGSTRINYTIGNELNINRYELERSDDVISFYTINTHAAFNRNGTEFYSYNDNAALKGTAYYRLKVIAFSSQVSYSAVASVSDHSKDLYVIKNPIDESIEIYAGTSATGTYNYSITSVNGQVMQAGTLDIKQPGTYSIKLQSLFAAGSYMLLMQNKDISLQKMVIRK
ncbi:MAG: hypothetical protein IPP96_07670 [Chitinophagaceae bacterium]|nr:hypothetical protein [Chitinophagaceae bacterium]